MSSGRCPTGVNVKLNLNNNTTNADLVKNYRFLFSLPKSTLSVYLAAVILSAISIVLENIRLGSNVSRIIFLFSVGGVAQLLTLEFLLVLLYKSPILSRRRLAGAYSFINSIFLLLALGTVPVIRSQTDYIGLSIMISLIILSLSLLILWPLFASNLRVALIAGIINVIPQWVIISFNTNLVYFKNWHVIGPISVGIISIILMITMLRSINNNTTEELGIQSFNFLKGFLNSWINSNSNELEDMMSKGSIYKEAKTGLIELVTQSGRKLCIVIPYVHPGPFFPVGSYDLPAKLVKHFTSLGYDNCFVLHGPVDHAYNLQTKQDTDEYINNLYLYEINGTTESAISLPVFHDFDSRQMIAIRLNNSTLMFISAWPGGSEDYPPSFIESIDGSIDNKYDKLFIVDSHNALGETPTYDEIQITIRTIRELLEQVGQSPLQKFNASFSLIGKYEANLGEDVGQAGIGVLMVEINDSKYALVVADSNNATKQVKENLVRELWKMGIRLIEFATSDTHFNATRIRNRRGYLLLGEDTTPEYIAKLVAEECTRLSSKLEPSSLRTHMWKTKVRLAKDNIFLTLRDSIQKSLTYLKVGFITLTLLVILGYMMIVFLP